ncbi:MAG: hypothetical protein KKB50_19365 [Planctomycetes bacterium]|nr:hypothetical protein [Planctomycetota bacterium]
MRQVAFVWITCVFLGSPALAQIAPQRGPGVPGEKDELIGQAKLKYMAAQLSLTESQQQSFDGLLEVYTAAINLSPAEMRDILERIRVVGDEIQAAKRAGDQERLKVLRDQMRLLSPTSRAEDEFFTSFTPLLTEEQTATLATVRQRLALNPGGALTPVDVVRVARACKLSQGQEKQLADIQQDFRKQISEVRSPDQETRTKLINGLITKVRGILTAEQTTSFDERITRLTPPKMPSRKTTMMVPTTQPGSPDKP